MRIALIAHHVAPIAPPFFGGVESHTWYLARWLARQGHDVTLFGLEGSEVPGVTVRPLVLDEQATSGTARRDVSALPGPFLAAHHAYLELLLSMARDDEFDAIHVNTLHHLPVAMAEALPVRPVLTLHCPPTPWLESALGLASARGPLPLDVVAVSTALADAWSHVIPSAPVIGNGIDLEQWRPGPGGTDCAWVGRMVPEKAPHLAIDAARVAGRAIRLAGPIIDHAYFTTEVEPRLGDGATYLGHCGHDMLRELVAHSAVSIQSPAWDEPFGLTAAEAIACGTPVAAFARGGLCDVVQPSAGALAEPDDVASLADAITRAAELDRAGVRAHAEASLGIAPMGRLYENAYHQAARGPATRPAPSRLRRRFAARGVTAGRVAAPASIGGGAAGRGRVPSFVVDDADR